MGERRFRIDLIAGNPAGWRISRISKHFSIFTKLEKIRSYSASLMTGREFR